MNWKRNGQKIEVPIEDYLESIIKDEMASGRDLKVSIGTDSQRHGKGYKFASIICIETKDRGTKIGRGGKLIISEEVLPVYQKGKEGVNDRMITEVGRSMDIALKVTPLLNRYDIKLEIHADINPNPQWESNKALKTAMGWVLGMGYAFKVKPDAYAASNCGDKFANG
jgi:predicted RNase H-related nuclease YkuK (DUF458 family)